LPAIKAMAGFGEDEGLHFNPRTAYQPPEGLKQKIFPWIEEEMDKVFATNEIDSNTRITAISTLRFWVNLRTIILQDAAAMIVLHPDRVFDYPFFRLQLFHDVEFKVSSFFS
jgi:hypothetical protein